MVRVLIPFVLVTTSCRPCRYSRSVTESHSAQAPAPTPTTAATATATVHTRQSARIAQWLLGEWLVAPAALEATLRFPLVLVTPVKLSLTCCKPQTTKPVRTFTIPSNSPFSFLHPPPLVIQFVSLNYRKLFGWRTIIFELTRNNQKISTDAHFFFIQSINTYFLSFFSFFFHFFHFPSALPL